MARSEIAGGSALATATLVAARDFMELDAWRLSKELQSAVLPLLDRFAFAQNSSLRSQLDDSAASAPRNIAEGFTRFKGREFAQFLRVALGSLGETRNHLIDARDRGYITAEERDKADHLARRAIGATVSLRRYLLSDENKMSGTR